MNLLKTLSFILIFLSSHAYSMSCNDLFAPSFPKGYGISDFDAKKAIEIGSVSPLTIALRDALNFFVTLDNDNFNILSRITVKVAVENAYPIEEGFFKGAARRLINIFKPKRVDLVFPQAFYESNLKTLGSNEKTINRLFNLIKETFPDSNLTSEGLAVLAFACEKVKIFNHSAFQNNVTFNAIKQYLTILDQTSRLPNFKEIIEQDTYAFVQFASFVNHILGPYSEVYAITHPFRSYGKKLLTALEEQNPTTIEQKIDLAHQLFRSDIQELALNRNTFKWLTSTRNEYRNLDRWLEVGARFIYFYERAYRFSASMSFFFGPKSPKDFVAEFFGSTETKMARIIYNAIDYAEQSVYREAVIGPAQVRAEIEKQFTSLSHGVRSEVKLARKREESIAKQEAAKRAQANLIVVTKSRGERQVSVRKVRESQPQEVVVAALEVEQLLPNAIPLEALAQGWHPQENVYYHFKYENYDNNPERIHYAQFSGKFISALKKSGLNLGHWLKAFLNGPTRQLGSNGTKRIIGAKKIILWEVKIIGPPFRILIEQNANNQWTFLTIIHHDQLDSYLKVHKL